MVLTKEDLNILKAPFKATEHEFLRGFVYITEFAIVTRIEDVDPAWQFEITALDSRPAVGSKNQFQVTCTAALTINGVTRYGVGQMKAYETKSYTDKKTGEQLTDEANEAEKSAATDALKRAARLFGIGRYLLVLPDNIKNEGQLATWIQRALEAKAKAKAEGLEDANEPEATDQAYRGHAYDWDNGLAEDFAGNQHNDRAALLREIDSVAAKHGLDISPSGYAAGVVDDEPAQDTPWRAPHIKGDDNRTPDYQDGAWSSDEIADQVVGGYEDAESYPADTPPSHQRNDSDALVRSIDDIADKPEAEPTLKEYSTTPTNIVVRKIGLKKEYLIIEGCTFFSREAFRLLDYDEVIIESLGALGVTELPDTLTIVYTQEGDFKTPVRIRRNSTNAVVDMMLKNEPVLLVDAGDAQGQGRL